MINLLPYNQKKIVDRLRSLRVGMTVLIAIAVLFVVGIILFIPTFMTINTRYEIVTKQIEQFRAGGTVANPSDMNDLQVRTAVLVEKFAPLSSQAPIAYVKLVRNVVSSSISLSGFVIQSGTTAPTMQVSGVATNREAVQAFVEKLKATTGVVSVESPLSNLVKSHDVEFTLTITFAS